MTDAKLQTRIRNRAATPTHVRMNLLDSLAWNGELSGEDYIRLTQAIVAAEGVCEKQLKSARERKHGARNVSLADLERSDDPDDRAGLQDG